MPDRDTLRRRIGELEGRGYKAYRVLEGRWSFPTFELTVDHVQGDPFADASRMHVVLGPDAAGFPDDVLSSVPRRVGVAAFLARRFADAAKRESKVRGSGKSGQIRMAAPGQEVLPTTAVTVSEEGTLEARFTVGLPARGRRIDARAAVEVLLEDVPAIVRQALVANALERREVLKHATTNEDAEALRARLRGLGLVAFVENGAVLPRASGVRDTPLRGGEVVPFESPLELQVSIDLPNAGTVTGMGIPTGVTLIVGGGYHGKSTLLQALSWGVYNHRPGDGRERVVSDAHTVKVRAEDGRAVSGVDISSFIGTLPLGQGTRFFSSDNASGSTSQAAGIVEAMEAGARVLLVDEDTAATNFMIRDRRMQELVPRSGEPIIPFIDRVRQLWTERGVSTVLVIGGSGDYLDVANTVVLMDSYRPRAVTDRAKAVAESLPTGRRTEVVGAFPPPNPRVPHGTSIDPAGHRRSVDLKVPDRNTVRFGREIIDLSRVEQIVSVEQARALAAALAHARAAFIDDRRSVPDILDAVDSLIAERGLDAVDRGRRSGDLAAFRRFELAAAMNRLRTLRVRRPGD